MWIGFLILVLFGFGLYYSFGLRRPVMRRRSAEPIEIARLRLARGEITSEEFEEIRQKIQR
jgi:uncharacterized membrane protein